jgi:peptide/nickel transport system substrate-binding protein
MRIIDVYRQRLAQIGIQMTIRQVDFRTLLSVCPRHDFQAYAIIWRVDTVGTDLYDLFHSSQTKDGNNWQNLKSPSIDKLLDEFRSTRDEARRVELGQSIHRAVMEEQPICFLFSSPSCIVWNRRVKGVQSHPLGLREWDMYLAPKKK